MERLGGEGGSSVGWNGIGWKQRQTEWSMEGDEENDQGCEQTVL